MKIARMFAATALMAASLGVSSAASAQNYGGDRYNSQDQRGGYQDRRDEGDRNGRGERGYDRRDERDYQGRDGGYNGRDRRSYGHDDRGNEWGRHDSRCRTEWRHHHPVTRCW